MNEKKWMGTKKREIKKKENQRSTISGASKLNVEMGINVWLVVLLIN